VLSLNKKKLLKAKIKLLSGPVLHGVREVRSTLPLIITLDEGRALGTLELQGLSFQIVVITCTIRFNVDKLENIYRMQYFWCVSPFEISNYL